MPMSGDLKSLFLMYLYHLEFIFRNIPQFEVLGLFPKMGHAAGYPPFTLTFFTPVHTLQLFITIIRYRVILKDSFEIQAMLSTF